MTATEEAQKKEMEKRELEEIKKREKEDKEKKEAAALQQYKPITILKKKLNKAEKKLTDLENNKEVITDFGGGDQEKKWKTAEARIDDAYDFMRNETKFNAANIADGAATDNSDPNFPRNRRLAYIKNMVAADDDTETLANRITERPHGANNGNHKLSTDLTAGIAATDLNLERLKGNPPTLNAANHDPNVLGNIFTCIVHDDYKKYFDGCDDTDGTGGGYNNYDLDYLDVRGQGGGGEGIYLYTLVNSVGAGNLMEDKKTELERCVKDVSARFLDFLKAYNFIFNDIGWFPSATGGVGIQYKGNYTIAELKDALKKKLGKQFSVRDIEEIIFDINVVQRFKPCDGVASDDTETNRFANADPNLVNPKNTLTDGTSVYADPDRLKLYQHSEERRQLWYQIDPTSVLAKNDARADAAKASTALLIAQSCRRYGPSETPISTLKTNVDKATNIAERNNAQDDLDERKRLLAQFEKAIDEALEKYTARKYKFPVTQDENYSHLVGDEFFMKAFYQDKTIQGLVVDFLKKCDGGSKKMTIRSLETTGPPDNGVEMDKSDYVEFVEMGSVTNNVILRYIFEKSIQEAYSKIKLEDETKKVTEIKDRYKGATSDKGIESVYLKGYRGSLYNYDGVKLLQKKLKHDNLVRCVFYYAKNVAKVTGGYPSMGASYSEETLVNFADNTEKLNMMFDDIEIPDGYKRLFYSAVDEARKNIDEKEKKEKKKKEDKEKALAEAKAAKAKADAAKAPAPAPGPSPAPSPAPGPSPPGDKESKKEEDKKEEVKKQEDEKEKEVEEKLKEEIDKTPQKKDSKEKKLEYIKQLDELRKQKDLEIDAKHKELSGKIDLLEASKTQNEKEIEKLNREKEITLETINISLQELRSYKEGYNSVTEKKRNILIDYVDRLKKKQLIQDQNYSNKVLENEKHKRLLTQIKNERLMLLKLKQDYDKQKSILEQKEREIMEEKIIKEKEKEQRERIQSLKENRLKKQLDELKRIQHIKEKKLKKEIQDLKEKQKKLQEQFHTSSTEELSSNPEDKEYLLQREVLKGKEKQLRKHLKKSLKKGKAPITYVSEDKPSKKSKKFTRKKPKRKKKESFIESITPDFMKVKV